MANNLVSIAIVLVLLSYLLIFFAYKHDIDQCNTIIDEKELACNYFDQTYECQQLQETKTNLSDLNITITNNGE